MRSLTPAILEAAYQSGTLHVVQSAPRHEWATRITLAPKVEKSGDYLAVLLHWVGDVAYGHTAMVRSALAENTLGLGILRSVFKILTPWDGPEVKSTNVLKGNFDPDSAKTQYEIVRRPGAMHADDQPFK